ncbi:MAG: peptide deformylase [Longimicrobiales bacterium]
MAIREVCLLGDPVLRRKAAQVQTVTPEVRALIADMFDTMYAEDGVGLAAPQIGVSERILVIDTREDGSTPIALVNPVLVEASEETEKEDEGCLSLPGLNDIVERSLRVIVNGLDREGKPQRIEAEGLLARALQHELDHIDGILFIDRVSPLKRQMLLKKWRKVKPVGDG